MRRPTSDASTAIRISPGYARSLGAAMGPASALGFGPGLAIAVAQAKTVQQTAILIAVRFIQCASQCFAVLRVLARAGSISAPARPGLVSHYSVGGETSHTRSQHRWYAMA